MLPRFFTSLRSVLNDKIDEATEKRVNVGIVRGG